MKKLIALSLLLVPALALAAGPTGPTPPSAAEMEIGRLHKEIAAIKLDRTLNLSRDQARALLPVVREGQKMFEQARAERERNAPAVIKALTAARDELRRDGKVSDATAKALKEARGDAKMKGMHEQGKGLREKAKSILTPDQLQALRSFKPGPLQGQGPGDEEKGGFGGGEEREGRHGKGGHERFGKGRMGVLMVVNSPEFISLLEARAK